MVLARTSAVVILAFMALCKWAWQLPLLILPLYIIRFSLGNCTYGLSKSILNDYVPKVRAPSCMQAMRLMLRPP